MGVLSVYDDLIFLFKCNNKALDITTMNTYVNASTVMISSQSPHQHNTQQSTAIPPHQHHHAPTFPPHLIQSCSPPPATGATLPTAIVAMILSCLDTLSLLLATAACRGLHACASY
jgi:hypothetical protein